MVQGIRSRLSPRILNSPCYSHQNSVSRDLGARYGYQTFTPILETNKKRSQDENSNNIFLGYCVAYISLYDPSTGFLLTPVYCCGSGGCCCCCCCLSAPGVNARYVCCGGCAVASAAGVYERCPGYADTGEAAWAGRPGVSEGGG